MTEITLPQAIQLIKAELRRQNVRLSQVTRGDIEKAARTLMKHNNQENKRPQSRKRNSQG